MVDKDEAALLGDHKQKHHLYGAHPCSYTIYHDPLGAPGVPNNIEP